MPVLDGYDATRLIRIDEDAAVRSVLIIAMTASAIRGDREKCLEAGMNNYLAKPVRAAVLKSMLEEYLNQPPRAFPNLQEVATQLARGAINDARVGEGSNMDKLQSTPTEPSGSIPESSGNQSPKTKTKTKPLPSSTFPNRRQNSAIKMPGGVRSPHVGSPLRDSNVDGSTDSSSEFPLPKMG